MARDFPGKPRTPFNMSNDSDLFFSKNDLEKTGEIANVHGRIETTGRVYLPLYESKLIHQFNHRYSTFAGLATDEVQKGNTIEFQSEDLADSWKVVECRYWLDERIQAERFPGNWFLVFRDIARATDVRTSIAAIIPDRPCSHSLTVVEALSPSNAMLLCSTMNSYVYDYVARQKIPGVHLNQWIWKQLPVLNGEQIASFRSWTDETLNWIASRVLELTYTAWDLQIFAQDCGYNGSPFRWDDDRRFLLRCELDAAYFHLYSIDRDDVDYIMETFPIVKRKDEKAHGHYRTKDQILEIYDAMAEAVKEGRSYQTLLDPPPADPQVAHPPR